MTEADIMATTFFHTCTISRPEPKIIDGWTQNVLVDKYIDIPCAVSTGGGSGERVNDEYVPVEYEDTLYTRPEVLVLPGDTVTATIWDEVFLFQAGEGRRYHSHRQTPLMRRGRA